MGLAASIRGSIFIGHTVLYDVVFCKFVNLLLEIWEWWELYFSKIQLVTFLLIKKSLYFTQSHHCYNKLSLGDYCSHFGAKVTKVKSVSDKKKQK